MVGNAISSSIAIVFLYITVGVILTLSTDLKWLITPLPFASFASDSIRLFSFAGNPYTAIASELLSMIMLAFLMNLIDSWLSKSKNFFSWLLLRCATIVIGLLLYSALHWLFNRYFPGVIITYAPLILTVVLIVMLLTGALRFIVGAALVAVNPVIAGLYTFFFASFVGKQITRAVLTTGIITGLIMLTQKLGIVAFSLVPAAILAYIPILILLIIVWYVINRVF